MHAKRRERKRLKKKVVFHRGRLVAALNKYLRPLSDHEYLREWDLIKTQDMIAASQMPESVMDWIWQEKKDSFSMDWDAPIVKHGRL